MALEVETLLRTRGAPLDGEFSDVALTMRGTVSNVYAGPVIPYGRLFRLPAHTVFASTMAVLPSMQAQLAGVGGYGTSLTFLLPDRTPGVVWTATVDGAGEGVSCLELRASTDALPVGALTPSPRELGVVLLTVLDAVSEHLRRLPFGDPVPRVPLTGTCSDPDRGPSAGA